MGEIATLLGAPAPEGLVNRAISGFAPIEAAGRDDLSFVNKNKTKLLPRAEAGACILPVGQSGKASADMAAFESNDPRGDFARVAASMVQRLELDPDQPAIHPDAKIDPTASLGPGVIVGSDAAVGPNTTIGANSVIGPGVQIGNDARIGAQVTMFCCLLGNEVVAESGARIGGTGFGLHQSGGGLIAHFGRVIIQDRVSIGANTTLDRGMLGDTVIGEDSHIDNLCHIGHNVSVGKGVVMAAYAGISGSCVIGDNARFGGRVGLADHVVVGKDAQIAAGSAVLEDVPPGETWAGYPARPMKRWVWELAWLRRAAQKRKQ